MYICKDCVKDSDRYNDFTAFRAKCEVCSKKNVVCYDVLKHDGIMVPLREKVYNIEADTCHNGKWSVHYGNVTEGSAIMEDYRQLKQHQPNARYRLVEQIPTICSICGEYCDNQQLFFSHYYHSHTEYANKLERVTETLYENNFELYKAMFPEEFEEY